MTPKKYRIVLSREQRAEVIVYADGFNDALEKAKEECTEHAFSDFTDAEPVIAEYCEKG